MESSFEKIERCAAPELDGILGHPFRVLNDGFVRVIDYMGSDEAIVQAARVSYGKGTKKIHEDRGLIRYLLRHKHTTPFEMCEIKLHVRVPMDTWRQWIRHRTANVNEYSTRYSEAIDSAQMTRPEEWRMQSTGNRQGSSELFNDELGAKFTKQEIELHELTGRVYKERIEAGMAREQARKDLLLSTYTEAYWKVDLHNLLHFLALRMDSHAQLEIRKYAICIGEEIVKRWCPLAWDAFQDYIVNGNFLTRIDTEIIQMINSGNHENAIRTAIQYGFLNEDGSNTKKSRERDELEEKLKLLNIHIPW